MSQYRLLRGAVFLGTVTHLPEEAVDGSPWEIGTLEPSPEYENFRPLFDAEQQLLNDAVEAGPGLAEELLLNAVDSIQDNLVREPFSLEGPQGVIAVTEIHLDGEQVHWR